MHNIAVIGCGAIGLTSALAIQNIVPEANVTILAKCFTPNTTSDIAAGLWEPFFVQNTPPEKIHRWAKTTYDYVLELWKQGKAKEAGVILLPVIWVTDDPNFKMPDWMDIPLGFHQIPHEQLEQLSLKYQQKITAGMSFMTVIWEGRIFLPYLQQKFLKNGGKIVQKKVQNFEEISGYDVIVNCTGIEADKLADDSSVHPVRGQIAKTIAPWINHCTLGDTKDVFYIIPNIHNVTLGGTTQFNNYNLTVNNKDSEDIIRKCSLAERAIKSAEIIKHQVGLRPGRDKVRLEVEIKRSENNVAPLKIVHNYGHGGAGITLSVGCALDTAQLVKELLRNDTKRLECKL